MSEIKKLELEDVTLAYKEFGSGDRYLISTQNFFLSGCPGELLGNAPYDYHVFLIYMRGYGESTHIFDETPKDYTKIWGEDVIHFAEAMGIKSFYYTGISHGNWAGWYIAFHRPELLRGFVCVDGICQYRDKEEMEARMRSLAPFDVDAVVGNEEVLEKMAWMENWPTDDPRRLAKRAANHAEHLQILMGRKREEFLVHNNNMSGCEVNSEAELYEKLAKLNFPLMIWNGALDPLAKVEDCLRIAVTVPGARLLTYAELGHGGADECPWLAARDIDRFFRDTEDRIL